MSKYRNALPQLDGGLFLTDSGMETTLIFLEGWDLPEFASCDLLRSEKGTEAVVDYYLRHLEIARKAGTGFILESPTWRSSPDWGSKIGYSSDELEAINQKAVGLMAKIRDEHDSEDLPIVVSGCIGPRGDGYVVEEIMTADEARAYHRPQIKTYAMAGADMVTAITMTHTEEAIGVAMAAKDNGLPVAISFTVETDGRLPSGETLEAAIERVEWATELYPAYYMINCAHPTHFDHVLDARAPWVSRIRGLRANASRCSHAELEAATELDAGDPVELGQQYGKLYKTFPHITVMGGCCGTDHRHVEQISVVCAPLAHNHA